VQEQTVSAGTYGVRSMTATLRRALLVRPAAAGDFLGAGWRSAPDRSALRAEHDAFAEVLAGRGVDVSVVEPGDGLVDACYAYDPVLVTTAGTVELRMAKPARADEPPALTAELERLGVPTCGRLTGDAVADGGDMLWLDERTLGVGRGYRTNAEAIQQLAGLLADQGVTVERFDLPHHLGPDHVMHLLSVVSLVADDLALVHEPLAPVALLEALDERGIRRIRCAPEELDSQGCNALAVAPGVVVLADGNPETQRALERAGCEVHGYRALEINKGDGGPTCLTCPILRG
jgi:N-dimethylarginine dimethylaminohydrolase